MDLWCHLQSQDVDVTFFCAIHYADTVIWDQKWRLFKHALNLRRGGEEKQGRRLEEEEVEEVVEEEEEERKSRGED